MSEGHKTFLSMLIAIVLCLVAMFAVSLFSGCSLIKPNLPEKEDYPPDMYPCYLADVCMRMPAYAQQNPVECSISIQKCYRYTDYDKCENKKNPEDCFSRLGIRM